MPNATDPPPKFDKGRNRAKIRAIMDIKWIMIGNILLGLLQIGLGLPLAFAKSAEEQFLRDSHDRSL